MVVLPPGVDRLPAVKVLRQAQLRRCGGCRSPVGLDDPGQEVRP